MDKNCKCLSFNDIDYDMSICADCLDILLLEEMLWHEYLEDQEDFPIKREYY